MEKTKNSRRPRVLYSFLHFPLVFVFSNSSLNVYIQCDEEGFSFSCGRKIARRRDVVHQPAVLTISPVPFCLRFYDTVVRVRRTVKRFFVLYSYESEFPIKNKKRSEYNSVAKI